MKIRLGELRRLVADAINESEVYVDDKGYAHDDEGNTWFAGAGRGRTFGGTQYDWGHYGPRNRARPTPRPVQAGSRELDALGALLHRAPGLKFVASVRNQALAGRRLSPKQRAAIAKIMKRMGMEQEARLFEGRVTQQAWMPGRYYPAAQPLSGDDASRLDQPLGENDEDDLEEIYVVDEAGPPGAGLGADPTNSDDKPYREEDPYEQLGMHPAPGETSSPPDIGQGDSASPAEPADAPDSQGSSAGEPETSGAKSGSEGSSQAS